MSKKKEFLKRLNEVLGHSEKIEKLVMKADPLIESRNYYHTRNAIADAITSIVKGFQIGDLEAAGYEKLLAPYLNDITLYGLIIGYSKGYLDGKADIEDALLKRVAELKRGKRYEN